MSKVETALEFKDILKRWGLVAAPFASVGGFVCDVLTPMGPILEWVLYASLAIAIISGVVWFLVKRRQFKGALSDGKLTVSEIRQLTKKSGWGFTFAFFFCNVLIISLLLLAQNATGSEGKGLLAENIPGIENLQKSLLNIEHTVGNIDRRTQDIATGLGRLEAKVNTNPKAVEKLRSIESYDFPGVEAQIRKIFNRPIKFQLERESFINCPLILVLTQICG